MKKIIEWLKSLFKKTPSKKLSQIKVGKTQTWYGRVNFWAKDMSLLEKELDLLVKSNCSGYMIELAGWANSTGKMWTDKWLKDIESKYKKLLSMCRKRGLWLFVSIVNDNLGSKKYGDDGKHNVTNVMEYCKKLCKIVKENGSKNVVVQPVAETQTGGGKQFESYVKDQLSGFLTCFNGNGGHPSSSNGFSFYAVHPSAISASNPSTSLVVSDHGLIIRELNIGKALVAHGNPVNITKWVKTNKNKGVPVVGYYAFQVQDFDKDAIKALGNALK